MRIAFYAPIKPPDHPIPSGDRLIAANLLKALKLAGFQTELASRYICYSKRSAPEYFEKRKSGAIEEADRIIADYQSRSAEELPDVWITYHPYCKAPDWIGSRVCRALNLPYVTVEAAKTGQGVNNEWGPWRAEAQEGIRQADLHLCFKPTDRRYLTELLGSDDKLRDFPAFIDTEDAESSSVDLPSHWRPETTRLVTTGMMRPGKKVRNFELLAETMKHVEAEDWNLVIVGGGPEEENIRSMFADLTRDRIYWAGQVERSEVLGWMANSDIFIWPGWKEPIGMVYLEAQLMGLPVIASRSMGVPMVVSHEKTGLLSPEEDPLAMAENVKMLLGDKTLRSKFSAAAPSKVHNEHSIQAASARLGEILGQR